MNLRTSLAALTLLLVLSACGQSTSNPITPPTSSGKQHLGLVEISFNRLGTSNFSTTARNISTTNQSRTITDITNGIQIESISRGSFDVGTRGVDGMRYLSATFKVRNAAAFCAPTPCTPAAYPTVRQNLTFMAVSTQAPLTPTLGQTAISKLKLFDGSDANPSLAQGILPTHGMDYDRAALKPKVSLGGEDLQAFQESEVSSLASLLLPYGVTSVFPYGFVAHCINNCTANTRDISANPATNQFDGSVTFAVKLPLQATSAADPYSFSLLLEVVDDSTTRVTQSLEEQTTPSAVVTRAAALTGGQVFTLPGVFAPTTCSVRTAGTVASPLAYLVNSVALSATPSLANQMFAASNATITAPFAQPMTVASSSNFSVQGLMTGQKSGTYTAPANNLDFTPTTASRPGEELEVTLTNGVSSSSGLSLCPNYTFRYRTAVATTSLGTFSAATNLIPAGQSFSATVGDVNNNGNLDLITANYDTSNVSVFKGNGDGTFQAAVNFTTAAFPYGAAVGDVNNDGNLDILTANIFSSNASVLLGNGDGTFQTATNYVTSPGPHMVVVGDVNSDGKLDLMTSNYTSNNVSVLLGNGNGTFQTASSYATGTLPYSLAVGDVNNDGKLDLLTSNYTTNNASVLLNNGNGTFATAVNYSTDFTPYSVTVGDVNNDGNLDLLTANYFSNNVSVLLGNGNGTFAPAINYVTNNTALGIVLSDVNGDAKLDLLTTNNGAGNVSVLLGNGNGTFQAAANYNAGGFPYSLATGDINNDGKLDVLTANANASDVSVLLQP